MCGAKVNLAYINLCLDFILLLVDRFNFCVIEPLFKRACTLRDLRNGCRSLGLFIFFFICLLVD